MQVSSSSRNSRAIGTAKRQAGRWKTGGTTGTQDTTRFERISTQCSSTLRAVSCRPIHSFRPYDASEATCSNRTPTHQGSDAAARRLTTAVECHLLVARYAVHGEELSWRCEG